MLQLGREVGKPISLSHGRAELDAEGLALPVAQFLQALRPGLARRRGAAHTLKQHCGLTFLFSLTAEAAERISVKRPRDRSTEAPPRRPRSASTPGWTARAPIVAGLLICLWSLDPCPTLVSNAGKANV